MSTHETLLFLHLLGVFVIVGAAGVSTAVGLLAGQSRDPVRVGWLMDLQRRSELFGTLPGLVVAVVFGSWLVDEAGFEFSETWISAAYTLVIVVLALDHGILLRLNRAVRQKAEELQDEGVTESDEIRSMASAPPMLISGLLLDLSLIAFLYLMVVKPGG